jgi:hypothetical protein
MQMMQIRNLMSAHRGSEQEKELSNDEKDRE